VVISLFIYWAGVELRPFIGLLYQPCMIGGDDRLEADGMNGWRGKLKYLEKTCRSANLSTTIPDSGPSWWEADNSPPELWHGHCDYILN
jgi:hypothetical protein